MKQPLAPDEEHDDQQQQELEIQQDAETAQNYQEYHQSQAENHYDDEYDEMEQHIRQVEEQEIELEEQRLAEFLCQHKLPTAHKTFIDPPQQHPLGGINIEC